MGAQDIIEALDKINFDRVAFMQALIDFGISRGEQEVDLHEITNELILIAGEKGLIKPWMDELISMLTPESAHDLLLSAAKDEIEDWLRNNNLQDKVDELLDKLGGTTEPEPEPVPPPPPVKPKMKKFVPVGNPVKLLSGWDNGVTTMSSNGTVAMISGDGFIGSTKYGTGIHILEPNADPMNPSNYKFLTGTNGKSYGALYFKGQLLSLQTDTGSGYAGAMNCRFWNVATGRRSTKTLQSLHSRGVNWFFIQKGPGYEHSYQKDTVDIGCVSFAGSGHAAHNKNFCTPVRMWRGDPNNIDSFKFIGHLKGVSGRRNNWATTCSQTYIKDSGQHIVVLGDWTVSEVQRFVTQADNVMGPFSYIGSEKFSPPMKRKGKDGQWSGVFTGNYFKRGEQWYEVLSGHRADLAKEDDSVWIRKVKVVV